MEKLGSGTIEATPVETGALPAKATSTAEAGSHVHHGGDDVTGGQLKTTIGKKSTPFMIHVFYHIIQQGLIIVIGRNIKSCI